MFSWFKRSNPAFPKPTVEAGGQPDLDKIARPLRPGLKGFSNQEEASTRQRLLALQWAKEWTGNALLPIPTEQLLEPLENALSGKLMKAKDPAHPVVSHAARALSLSAQETRAERTKDAFPWIELRLGPQEHPCQAAKQRAGRIVPFSKLPHIPLPECDEAECMCWFRQVTKAEASKRNSP